MLYCAGCEMHLETELTDKCPYCGSQLIEAASEPGKSGLNLQFGVFGCSECGFIYALNESITACPGCGDEHSLLDRHVEARARVFGEGLGEVQSALEEASALPLIERGEPQDLETYRTEVYRRGLGDMDEQLNALVESMNRGDWTRPDDAETQAAWRDAQALLYGAIDLYADLKSVRPPPIFLSNHRAFVRALFLFASFGVEFFQTLVSPSLEVARRRQAVGQEALDKAGELLTIAGQCLRAGEALRDEGLQPTELEEERDQVALAFPEVQDVLERNRVLSRPLASIALLSSSTQDSERRAARVSQVEDLLNEASDTDEGWLLDMDYLETEVARGWRQLLIQHARLADVARQGENTFAIETALDSISKLLEGPVRRLGTILLAAHATSEHQSPQTELRIQSWTSVQRTLLNQYPLVLAELNPTLRNAEAHNDYDIISNRIEINHQHRNDPPQVDTLSFADVNANAFLILEITLGVFLGLLRWSQNRASLPTRRRFNRSWIAA